jgi:hypothetical protein
MTVETALARAIGCRLARASPGTAGVAPAAQPREVVPWTWEIGWMDG